MLLLLFNSVYAGLIGSHNVQLKSNSPNERVRRVDRKSVFEHVFTQVDTEAFLFPTDQAQFLVENGVNALAAEDAFQMNLSCDFQIPKIQCDKVKNALQRAGARIASVFQIQTPIVVSCEYTPFCENTPNCDLANVLGGAQYASAFEVENNNGGTSMYPQALVKNLKVGKQLQYGKVDIIAQFNSEHNFYFREDGIPITDLQVDFEYVATHELIHGWICLIRLRIWIWIPSVFKYI
jgi:hypothetical protein